MNTMIHYAAFEGLSDKAVELTYNSIIQVGIMQKLAVVKTMSNETRSSEP